MKFLDQLTNRKTVLGKKSTACGWQCGCGAMLKVYSRGDRLGGESNYAPDVGAADLNWNGLAEERGWLVEPEIQCPACQHGLTLKQYKIKKALGQLQPLK